MHLLVATPYDGAVPATSSVTGPLLHGRGWPFGAPLAEEVADHGYVMEEFLASGVARSYPLDAGAEATRDGRWRTVPGAEAPYTTRLFVLRPADPARFNGVVLCNWQNVTAGIDLGAPSGREPWRGYAWVGITTQRVGVEGTAATTGLRDWDPERYGELEHPGDAWSYDIFTQVGRALGPERPTVPVDPLGGLAPRIVIAQGASQSACRLASYYDGVHAHEGFFDAFLLTVHFSVCVLPDETPIAPTPEGQWLGTTHIRDDLATPVMIVNSETEAWSMFPFRRADTDTYRFWEIAGGAHTGGMPEAYLARFARDGVAFSGVGAAPAELPNTLDWSYVADAATRHLVAWVTEAAPPPSFPPISIEHRDPHNSVLRDEHGVALGGLRLPDVDAPVAAQCGANVRPGEQRRLSGERLPFDQELLRALYPDAAAYCAAWDAAVERIVAAGGVLAEDAADLRARGRRIGREAGVC
jgi:Alpha/beta hydrolase domain